MFCFFSVNIVLKTSGPQRNSSRSGSPFMGPTAPQTNHQHLWKKQFMDGSTRFKKRMKWAAGSQAYKSWLWKDSNLLCFLWEFFYWSCRLIIYKAADWTFPDLIWFIKANSHSAFGFKLDITPICNRLTFCSSSHLCFHLLNTRNNGGVLVLICNHIGISL